MGDIEGRKGPGSDPHEAVTNACCPICGQRWLLVDLQDRSSCNCLSLLKGVKKRVRNTKRYVAIQYEFRFVHTPPVDNPVATPG